eukprot:jgi/Chlat1/183/Chrsp1S03255
MAAAAAASVGVGPGCVEARGSAPAVGLWGRSLDRSPWLGTAPATRVAWLSSSSSSSRPAATVTLSSEAAGKQQQGVPGENRWRELFPTQWDGSAREPEAKDAEEEDAEEEDGEEKEAVPVSFERWQLRKLSVAALKGRRHVDINVLSKELKVDRRAVIDWLKANARIQPQPSTPATDAATDGSPLRSDAAASDLATAAEPALEQASPFAAVERSRLQFNATTEATLERVYQSAKRPSDELVAQVADLTRLPRRTIVSWFAQRRSAEMAEKGTNGYWAGRGSRSRRQPEEA